MKVIREICTRCGKEKEHKTDTKDYMKYEEEIKYKKCESCKAKGDTAEDKLLDAIFGHKEDD